MYISKDEQKERLEDRRDTPYRQYRFTAGDVERRKQWDEYLARLTIE